MSYAVLSIEHERDDEGVWVARLRVREERGDVSPERIWTLRNEGGEPGNWFAVDCDEPHDDWAAGEVAIWADDSNEVAELLAHLERTKP